MTSFCDSLVHWYMAQRHPLCPSQQRRRILILSKPPLLAFSLPRLLTIILSTGVRVRVAAYFRLVRSPYLASPIILSRQPNILANTMFYPTEVCQIQILNFLIAQDTHKLAWAPTYMLIQKAWHAHWLLRGVLLLYLFTWRSVSLQK